MVNRNKPAAALLASLILAPVLAAGRPACCAPVPAVKVVSHACCAAMSGAMASPPKGCCKAPTAPKPETRVKDHAQLAAAVPTVTLGAPEPASVAVPAAVSARLARRAHHADAPDDSPPDLLSRIHVLLI